MRSPSDQAKFCHLGHFWALGKFFFQKKSLKYRHNFGQYFVKGEIVELYAAELFLSNKKNIFAANLDQNRDF